MCQFWKCGFVRKMMGQSLDSCSVKELSEIATQIEKSLHMVRLRKVTEYKIDLPFYNVMRFYFQNHGVIA